MDVHRLYRNIAVTLVFLLGIIILVSALCPSIVLAEEMVGYQKQCDQEFEKCIQNTIHETNKDKRDNAQKLCKTAYEACILIGSTKDEYAELSSPWALGIGPGVAVNATDGEDNDAACYHR